MRKYEISEKSEYWVLTSRTAVKMTVKAIEKNPDWPVKYTVQKGDTLAAIAEKFYDDEDRWKDIAKANKIKDAAKIQPGMLLALPPVPDNKEPIRGLH